MKLIIAGSRILTNISIKNIMYNAFTSGTFDPTKITEVVCGGASGIDTLGAEWAVEEYWYDSGHTYKNIIPVKNFPANFKKLGKKAGPIRNAEMGAYADALLLIWDGQSKGSASMKAIMQKLNKPIYEVIIK